MNRIVSGKIRLDVQRLELASIVEAALDSVRPSAEAKSITLRRTIDPAAGLVFGDPNRLQQVTWNLLTNAVKFTPRGGKIDVIVQRVNSHVEIEVRDSGMGISAAFLPPSLRAVSSGRLVHDAEVRGPGPGPLDVRSLGSAGGGRTPAIALTAFARSEDRTRAMLAGYQVHVSKPIEAQELVATIRSLATNSGDRDV